MGRGVGPWTERVRRCIVLLYVVVVEAVSSEHNFNLIVSSRASPRRRGSRPDFN